MLIPTSELSSLNQVIIWLQNLYENQRKGLLDSAFDIKNYVSYKDIPLCQELILSNESLCDCAAQLFAVHQNTVTLIKTRSVMREHCYEVIFDIAGKRQSFFIKNAWEGAIKEAIGLEFNNLLTDTPIRYLCGKNVIITEKVFESLPITLYELRESDDYMFAYGAWEIFTNLLRLTDRKTTNVRWNGSRLANIDFGLVFYKGVPVFDSRFTLSNNTEQRTRGQIYALQHILTRFWYYQEKLGVLLVNLDVNFCRGIPCSRIPREPLVVLLTELKLIDAEIRKTIIIDTDKMEKSSAVIVNDSVLTPRNKTSVLTSLLNNNGLIYAAIITNEGVMIEEMESSSYLSDAKLRKSVSNPQLLNLMIKQRHSSILKTIQHSEPRELIQIDLTEMRLLVMWNHEHHFMLISFFELNASVAHIKVNMSKVINLFIANKLNTFN